MPISAARRTTFTLAILTLASAPDARALAQQPRDSTQRRDSAVTLPSVGIRASIAPTAGSAVGSAVPARLAIVTGRQLGAREARGLADVLGAGAGGSLYDGRGPP